MAKRRLLLAHRQLRSVLTDMLPFEVPPTFSNRGFYRFLKDNDVTIDGQTLSWTGGNPSVDLAVGLIFGLKNPTGIRATTVVAWGRTKNVKTATLERQMATIPFSFRVAHKQDGRSLSVVHPRNQVEVAGFYAKHSALIIYYAGFGEFSIRRPVSVARFAFYKDKLHEQRLETLTGEIEEHDKEYEELGSYFVYKRYRNIHRFFESYQYHRSEKKYNAMVQIDISKCFDSIYTHSICWAVTGKSQTKAQLPKRTNTFGDRFDRLMQKLNHNETNGIVIGPEFSRIFAEIILQSIDRKLKAGLHPLLHKIDYEIFRYVDDYFIFYNDESAALKIQETLQEVLRFKKLSINTEKIKYYRKPVITEITIAKTRVSELLNEEVSPDLLRLLDVDQTTVLSSSLRSAVNANRLITRYKAVLKENGVEYEDILNYTLSIVENKISSIINMYNSSDRNPSDMKSVVRSFLSLLEFGFFAYSASPKVNHTIRLCRAISTCVEFLNTAKIAYEMKHQVFKYIHDNVIRELKKNTMTLYREIESLYFLVSLSQIGRTYALPESILAKHFLITTNEQTGMYERSEPLSHFSITILLTYIKNKVRYLKIKDFIQGHILDKMKIIKAHCDTDSEAMLMLLDLTICPYISDTTKLEIGQIFGLKSSEIESLKGASDRWFTVWGDHFDIGRELDAKRSREVY